MRSPVSALLVLAALGCAPMSAGELRLEGEQTLRACGERRVDTSLCLGLELIQAEYELCLRQHPGDARCEEVWQALAKLSAPERPWPPPRPLSRGFYPER
jgi:hypothetical protein